MKRPKNPNRGYLYERINHNPLERSLADSWELWNNSKLPPSLDEIIGRYPTFSDRFVAASVVQWLGTNVGFSFLQSAFREVGYVIHGETPVRTFHWPDDDPMLREMLESVKIDGASKAAAQLLFDLSEPS